MKILPCLLCLAVFGLAACGGTLPPRPAPDNPAHTPAPPASTAPATTATVAELLNEVKKDINSIGSFDLSSPVTAGSPCGKDGKVHLVASPIQADLIMKTVVTTQANGSIGAVWGFVGPTFNYTDQHAKTQQTELAVAIAQPTTMQPLSVGAPPPANTDLHSLVQAYLQGILDMDHNKPCFVLYDPNAKGAQTSKLVITFVYDVVRTGAASVKIIYGIVTAQGQYSYAADSGHTIAITLNFSSGTTPALTSTSATPP